MTESIVLHEMIEKEIEDLQLKKFLEPNDSIDNILSNHYDSKDWADAFWSRRFSHSSRPDPEVEIVFETNPESILDIGSAYGRVLKKFCEEKEKRKLPTQIFGIERCQYHEENFRLFQEQEPLLNDVQLFFEDFFDSKQLKGKKFDVIVLSMNTFSEFGPNGIPMLFKTVQNYLTGTGRFIFSSAKYLDDEPVDKLLKVDNSAQLILNKGEKPIILDVYTKKNINKNGEVEKISYFVYYHFDDYYKERQKRIYRITGSILRKGQILKKIQENGFKIEKVDDAFHSFFFICKKG